MYKKKRLSKHVLDRYTECWCGDGKEMPDSLNFDPTTECFDFDEANDDELTEKNYKESKTHTKNK